MVYYNPYITGWISSPKSPKQRSGDVGFHSTGSRLTKFGLGPSGHLWVVFFGHHSFGQTVPWSKSQEKTIFLSDSFVYLKQVVLFLFLKFLRWMH